MAAPGAKTDVKQRAATRLALLAQARRPHRSAVMPGLEQKVELVVLTADECQEALAGAHRRFSKLGLDAAHLMNLEAFNDECANQCLARALRDPADLEKTIAEGANDDERADDLRRALSLEERAALYDLYEDFRKDVDPQLAELSPELATEILDLVKKKDATRLRGFASRTLVSFMLSTASPPGS